MPIAQTHTLEAFQLLWATFAKARDLWFWIAFVSAVALTRQQQATDWLLDLIEREYHTTSTPTKPSVVPPLQPRPSNGSYNSAGHASGANP
jgi:hypothetical protein